MSEEQIDKQLDNQPENQAVKQTDKQPDIYQKLVELLRRYPELAVKLYQTLDVGRFFITITCQYKEGPEDKNDLHHYWMRQAFNVQDVLLSITHIENDFKAREIPTSELKKEAGWH